MRTLDRLVNALCKLLVTDQNTNSWMFCGAEEDPWIISSYSLPEYLLDSAQIYSLGWNTAERSIFGSIKSKFLEGWASAACAWPARETHCSVHARNLSQHASVETALLAAADGGVRRHLHTKMFMRELPLDGSRLQLRHRVQTTRRERAAPAVLGLSAVAAGDPSSSSDDSRIVFCFPSEELLINGADSSAPPCVCSYSHPLLSCF